jgi:hypothetical protein
MNSMKIWNNSLANRAEGTRKQYFYYFGDFIEWSGLSPDELQEMKYQEDWEAKP